ncbi:8671_t:CDS:2 [Gigaspora margarita]|uniref:8671_t:CDS:1 n=1 Tax=Gigaspora margarita TaxID=4874 RepID=A0ABN7VDZ3_GIGMA|nr:8671_t:CDS:2 [Gigaspora margarita]
MSDYFFTVVTFISILLCIIPGIFHFQTKNWGAILMIFWVIVTNAILFINSILWANNLDDKAPIYCLITSPIYVGSNFGLLASISCMIHTLYTLIACPMIITESIRRRQAIIDFCLIILVPMFLSGCFYLVQTNKYGIRPVLGCFSPAYVNGLFFLVDGIWPVLISIIGCYYAARTTYSIMKKRLEIHSLLRRNESGLNTAKFYRLVFFCITYLIFSFPASVLTFFSNVAQSSDILDFRPVFVGYNTIYRSNFNTVPLFVASGLSVFDYAKPLTGFFVFLFFGTGRDASSAYIRWAKKVHLDKVFKFLRDNYDDLRSVLHQSDSFDDEKNETATVITTISATKPKPKKGLGNMLFLGGHRTPTEQAQIDMTSGIHIRIDGLTTNIIEEENDHSIEDPSPVYQMVDVVPRGIHETFENYDNMRLDEHNDTSTFGPLSRSDSVKSSLTIYEYNNSLKPKTVQHTNIQPAYVDASAIVHIEDDYITK